MLKSQGVREGPPRCFGSMVAFFLCLCFCFLFIYTLYTLHLHKQLSTYLLELFFVPSFTFLGGSNITGTNMFVSNSSMTSQYTTAEFLNLDWPYATSHQWVHMISTLENGWTFRSLLERRVMILFQTPYMKGNWLCFFAYRPLYNLKQFQLFQIKSFLNDWLDSLWRFHFWYTMGVHEFWSIYWYWLEWWWENLVKGLLVQQIFFFGENSLRIQNPPDLEDVFWENFSNPILLILFVYNHRNARTNKAGFFGL